MSRTGARFDEFKSMADEGSICAIADEVKAIEVIRKSIDRIDYFSAFAPAVLIAFTAKAGQTRRYVATSVSLFVGIDYFGFE